MIIFGSKEVKDKGHIRLSYILRPGIIFDPLGQVGFLVVLFSV